MDTEKLDYAQQLLKVCRLKILNIGCLRLFGCILYKFDILFTDDNSIPTAICTIRNKRPTIIFNINFVNKLTNFRELLFILIHEISHFINHHLTRARDKHRHIYNLAGDHIINKMLLEDSRSSLREHIADPAKYPALVFDEIIYENWTTDEVYVWIMENKAIEILIDAETGEISVKLPGRSTMKLSPDLNPNENETNLLSDKEAQEIETVVNEIRSEIRAAIDNNLIGKGNSSSSKIFQFIDELTKVEIPWDHLVENCINSTITISPDNRSWKNINKRMSYYNYLMPSKGTVEKKDNLYILIDTSGSISTRNLSKFCYVIEGCLHYFDHIKIIHHDTTVTNTVSIRSSEFIEKKEELFKMYGRGGTSHHQSFKAIEDDYIDNEPIGMVLALTDYESDIEYIWNDFKWKDEIPFKLILTTDRHSVNPLIDPSPIIIKG
jgi:predicted metal-dependent peptidase